MPYQTAKLVGYGVIPPESGDLFCVVGLWTYRGKPSQPTVVGWYSIWTKAEEIRQVLEKAREV